MPTTTEPTSEEQRIVRDALAQLETIRDTVDGFDQRLARLEQQKEEALRILDNPSVME